ncbi:hypothetical protein RF11_09658 [Thelohanellus kitauei]|uniref:Uncharacterized protein n=1 Tax=Thelohanellus kitauei TaxID=669202 RepID=A0A0C2JWD0_THEKT|nr:hypothetical protein RF11_09658 [Thelohanellus kitauei]
MSETDQGEVGSGDAAAKKRQARRARAKDRKPTGVVILPPAMSEEEPEELRLARENAMANESVGVEAAAAIDPFNNFTIEEALRRIGEFECAIEEWQIEYNKLADELNKSRSETEKLTNEVKSLKRENEYLMSILKKKNLKP